MKDLKVNPQLTNVLAALLKRFARQIPDEQWDPRGDTFLKGVTSSANSATSFISLLLFLAAIFGARFRSDTFRLRGDTF